MEVQTVLYEVVDGIATLTLNRPARANAINPQLSEDVHAVLDQVELDTSIRVLIITGSGHHFCGGADLKERGTRRGPYLIGPPGYDMFTRMEKIPQPVIAAINGACMGGGTELAIACDFRFMADSATIGVPEIVFGGLPSTGGTQRLPRLVGLANARELIYTGLAIDAAEARRIGLVNRVVPAANLMAEAYKFAGVLKQRAAYALSAAKFLTMRSFDVDLMTGLLLENRLGSGLATTEEREAARRQAAESDPRYTRLLGADT
jgi:enoyl-CoA hydratase